MEVPATVAAVVVTYNRRDVLAATLEALTAQQRPVDRVYVVDNASTDGTPVFVPSRFPNVHYVRLDDNRGFAAGLAEGMRRAVEAGFSHMWLLDDDSRPLPAALQRLLEVSGRADRPGIVGLSGGVLRRGVPDRRRTSRRRVDIPDEEQVFGCDFTLVDGALIAREAVVAVGFPRGDFFMMLEDVEYTGRLSRAGWAVLLLDEPLIERGHLGSGGAAPGGSSPPWRGYYHTRNHLRMVLDQQSPTLFLGWLERQGKLVIGALLHSDRKLERVRLRLLGAWHALRGVQGRSLEPRP